MPRRVVVLIECEFCGNEADGKITTIKLDGKERELDLCDAHRAELKDLMTPWLDAGHKPQAEPKKAVPAARKTTAPSTPSASASDADKDGRLPCPAPDCDRRLKPNGLGRHLTVSHPDYVQGSEAA